MIPVSKDFYPNPKKTPSGLLKAGAGMNLFVWNMRYPDAKADTGATFEASPLGPKVISGSAEVKLLIGDSVVMEQPFNVIADPRNAASVS